MGQAPRLRAARGSLWCAEEPRAPASGWDGPTPERSSPERLALVPEGVEPVIAGLGALRGDGQQVGGAAASLDAACKTPALGKGSGGRRLGASTGPSSLGRARSWSQREEVRHPVAGPAETVEAGQQGGAWGWVWGALTAVLGVMAAEGKGEGWGGWAGAQDRSRVHGTGDHSGGGDVLGLQVNAGAGGLICGNGGRVGEGGREPLGPDHVPKAPQVSRALLTTCPQPGGPPTRLLSRRLSPCLPQHSEGTR